MAIAPAPANLARQARAQFVTHLEGLLGPLAEEIRTRLIESVDAAGSTREMQDRRDAMFDFERLRAAWTAGTRKAWRQALVPPTATARVRLEMGSLELIGDDVVENKILASRLATAVQEKAVWAINEIKLRIQHLEGTDDLASEDILRPEAVAQLMVEQWMACELPRATWLLAKDTVHEHFAQGAVEGYRLTNEFLVKNGVLPDIDMSARVRRPPSTPPARKPGAAAANEAMPEGVEGAGNGGLGSSGQGGHGGGHGGYGGYGGRGGNGNGTGTGQYSNSRPAGVGGVGGAAAGGATGGGGAGLHQGDGGGTVGGGATGYGPAGGAGGVHDETRMLTASTPLARARARASGVLGQLKRLLTDKVAGFDPAQPVTPSPALAEAMSQHATQVQTHVQTRVGQTVQDSDLAIFDESAVAQVAQDLRQRSVELKKKASTSNEKAIIEIVALMFQSILSEERIPAAVRVWFARLQMPVLRVAIAEPEFFGSLEHPARQLIDRMGSCVLGFNAATIGGSALETEIKRVVQVIEQYPETGRRVFQLVYDEFQKFLSRYLTEKGPTQKLVSVAQQVEQKETMAIQYTIEMRKLLSDVPVREEIREFLFKVWAEVLAVAAVRHGPQHEETVALKKAASELVWAASAKPNRSDRAKVIADLPALLLRLRHGMALIGVQGPEQESNIKRIGDTIADAFLSKTEAIPHARIEQMAKRLANLEDFIEDDASADLPLDKESIELMLGIDASGIELIASGGSQPSAAMQGWAQELQVGSWFTLDHNGLTTQVQYMWRSDRRQLHLFASSDGRSFLVQLRRLAAYLQAGLLVPNEEEALTVRATREALAKLEANPERLN
jgi:hypothetical protein